MTRSNLALSMKNRHSRFAQPLDMDHRLLTQPPLLHVTPLPDRLFMQPLLSADLLNIKMSGNLAKVVGDSLIIDVAWTASTKDSQGNPISWQYQLLGQLIDINLNTALRFFNVPSSSYMSRANGTHFSPMNFGPFTSFDAGRTYSVNVTLGAAKSDADGNPVVPSNPTLLSTANAPDVVMVSGGSGPASIQGQVGAIAVSQNPAFHRAQGGHMNLRDTTRFLTPISMTQGPSSTR